MSHTPYLHVRRDSEGDTPKGLVTSLELIVERPATVVNSNTRGHGESTKVKEKIVREASNKKYSYSIVRKLNEKNVIISDIKY